MIYLNVFRLNRYLNYEAVMSNKAIEAARADYRHASRDRQIRATLPKAWAKLVEEEDDILLELVADQVASLCGYKPDLKTVAHFLKENVRLAMSPNPPMHANGPIAPSTQQKDVESVARTSLNFIGFSFSGRYYPANSAIDVLIKIFEVFSERDPTFPQRFAALPKHGNKRRYLARSPSELYPDRPDLRDHSVRLRSGWYLGTNCSRETIRKIIKMACEVAGVTFGRELIVSLDQ